MATRARKSKYEINRELVLSTAHIPESDASTFDSTKNNDDLEMTYWWMAIQVFGYRINICDDICEEVTCSGRSAALLGLVQLARKLKCKWLVLDPDGEVRDDLPQFEW